MEILSVLCGWYRKKIQKSSRTTWNCLTQTLESSLWKKGAFRAAERDWLSSHLCLYVCYMLTLSLRMPNKTKNGFHVCVSLLLGLLIIIITSVSLSFAVLLDISALDGLVTPYKNRQTGMADQYQSCVVGVGASENCEEYKRKTFFS